MPLTPTPARDTTPNENPTGRLIKVLNIATLNIPEAIALNRLEQAFSHISRPNTLVYFCICPCTFPLILRTLATSDYVQMVDSLRS